MKSYYAAIKVLSLGLILSFLPACASQTAVRSTDLKIVRLGVESLTQKTEVAGSIKKRSDAVTNGDLWLLSGRQSDALEIANADKEQVRIFVIKSLEAMAEERARKCSFWQFDCKRKARDIGNGKSD